MPGRALGIGDSAVNKTRRKALPSRRVHGGELPNIIGLITRRMVVSAGRGDEVAQGRKGAAWWKGVKS